MLRLIGLVVSIGLADSLNPTTIAPALYLATGDRESARSRVTEFTAAVFLVYLVGGAIIALGPGQLLLSLIPHPGPHVRYILEIVAGIAMLTAAGFLWRHRDRLSDREVPMPAAEGKSSALLGATITAVELPTAFPYFAAIAAIVGQDLDPAQTLVLLLLFNVCFAFPLIVIVAVVWFAGDRAQELLTTGRERLQAHWPGLLAALALLAGLFVTLLGVTGFAGLHHGRFGRLARHVRHLLGQ